MTYHPWRELDALPGVKVVIEPLADCWGYYDEATNTIHLDRGMTQARRRCTLAHEMVHAENADVGDLNDWHHEKRERATNRTAARRLMPIGALADVLVWTSDEYEIADVMWVDVETVRYRLKSLTKAERDTIEERIDADIHGIA